MKMKVKRRVQKRAGCRDWSTGGKPKEPEHERVFKLESVTLARLKALGI